jgi:hypothetical protein
MPDRSAQHRAWTEQSQLVLQCAGWPCVVHSTCLHANVTARLSRRRQRWREGMTRQATAVANESDEASNKN